MGGGERDVSGTVIKMLSMVGLNVFMTCSLLAHHSPRLAQQGDRILKVERFRGGIKWKERE